MSKRPHKEVLKALLSVLSDGKEHSYGALEREVNTNWKTIRDHCEELGLFGFIEKNESRIKITKLGKEILSKL